MKFFKMDTKILPDKKFEIRDSTLSLALKDQHARSAYNAIIAFLVLLTIKNAIEDIYFDGGSEFGFWLIKQGFADLGKIFQYWLIMLAIHMLLFLCWNIWGLYLHPNKKWHTFWILAAFAAFFGTFHILAQMCLRENISVACRIIILSEQVRLIMKGYAFIRTKTKEYYKCGPEFRWPKWSQYIYFTFAPTLVYRNSYPRASTRSWTKALSYLKDVVVAVYFLSIIEYQYFVKPISQFGKVPFSTVEVFLLLLTYAIPSFLSICILGQFIILHSVQSAFAEAMQFGDRMFFKEWWTMDQISNFYTRWNVLIQDWLYEYIYKDVYLYVVSGNKFLSRVAVILVSAIFHELIMVYSVEITCPIFIPSMLAMELVRPFPKNRVSTITMIIVGQSLLFTLAHLEFYARLNCPSRPETLLYIPKLLTCY